ncbi:MAG: PQQ-binding-like beta-propeller repeat protein [Bacteroidota bacterium]
MNKKHTIDRIIPGILLGLVLLLASCSDKNWPQFRGPESNMAVANNNLPDEWGIDKNIRWTYDLSGTGWSSPIVWGNKIFISSAFPEKKIPVSQEPQGPPPGAGQGRPQGGPPPGMGQNRPQGQPVMMEDTSYRNDIYRWELTCIDLKTGKELWKKVARKGSPRHGIQPGNTYASETPVTDGKRIYVYFGMTGVYCYDFNGRRLWEKDLGAYKTVNSWGTGSSPVVYKDLLFIQIDNEIGSFVVALNSKNGEEKWRAGRDEKTNYCTPVIWKNTIRTELVTSGKTARSYDPATGKLLWQLKMGGEMNITSPVTGEEYLYIGKGAGREAKGCLFAVKAGAEGDITPAEGQLVSNGVAWSQPAAQPGNPSPLLHDGLLYLISGRGGQLSCFDAATGDSVYSQKIDSVGSCWASPWANNDKIFILDDKGTTHVIKAGKQMEALSRNKLDDKMWSSVAIAKDAYILKGVKRLYCIGK